MTSEHIPLGERGSPASESVASGREPVEAGPAARSGCGRRNRSRGRGGSTGRTAAGRRGRRGGLPPGPRRLRADARTHRDPGRQRRAGIVAASHLERRASSGLSPVLRPRPSGYARARRQRRGARQRGVGPVRGACGGGASSWLLEWRSRHRPRAASVAERGVPALGGPGPTRPGRACSWPSPARSGRTRPSPRSTPSTPCWLCSSGSPSCRGAGITQRRGPSDCSRYTSSVSPSASIT